MKRILFFITSLAGGGAEKVLVNMVNHMDKTKYHVTVLTLFDVGVNKKFLSKGIEYKYVFKKVIRGNTKLFKLFSPEFLYRHMVRDDYDIVVSYFQGATTRIISGCPNKDTKLVQWIHNEFHEKEKLAICYRSIDECIELQRRYNANVYVSKTVRDIYLRTFPEIDGENIVLYNVVESDRVLSLSKEDVSEQKLYDSDITIVSVGRFVRQKAFERLLYVVSKAKEDGFNIKLLLLGTGKLDGMLKLKCNELGIENSVEFLGYKENPYKYVKNADLFVCSSLHEGFSTAITEALIVGTPVLTTMCSGMEELLGNNEYGVIVDNNEEALYQGLKEFLIHREKITYYKNKSIERGKNFNLDETMEAIEKFFDSL